MAPELPPRKFPATAIPPILKKFLRLGFMSSPGQESDFWEALRSLSRSIPRTRALGRAVAEGEASGNGPPSAKT